MAAEKSILVQKHVRDNSEDLNNEFLDMKNWEERMKKAEAEITNGANEKILPPIRKKKKMLKETENMKKKESDAKSKRIKSSDYSSWEKFDADKACEEVEKVESESEESGEETLSKEELEKSHAEATKRKEEGNILVKQRQWAKAVVRYDAAIKIFPYDAVFYANRALCHLKLNDFYSAKADCSTAVELDENYVKAYHRRATAFIELKMYKKAAEDLRRILKLEPSNNEAKSMLLKLDKSMDSETRKNGGKQEKLGKPIEPEIKIDNSVSSTIKNSEKNEKKTQGKNEAISEKKDEKNSEKISIKLDKSQELLRKISSNENLGKAESKKDGNKEKSEENEGIIKEREKKMEEKTAEINKKNSKLPVWLPENNEDVEIVEITKKPLHQRSKKPFRTVPIKKIQFGKLEIPSETQKKEIDNFEKNESKISSKFQEKIQTENLENDNSKVSSEIESKKLDFQSKISKNSSEENEENLEAPKTAVQFILTWRKIKSLELRYKYLKQIPAKRLPTLFQDSLESNTFGEILNVLILEFAKRKEPVYAYVRFLCEVKRFRTLTMFMSKSDKKDLEDLFVYIKKVEGLSSNVIKDLKIRYEMQ